MRFWNQPCRAYRDFQLVYGGLALHFLLPGLGYLFCPDAAVASFSTLGALLGAGAYPLAERSYIWRVLAATNVLTLGFLCVFIQSDLRRHWPAVYPLLFMKGMTAALYAGVYLWAIRYPAFLAVALWDALNCVAFLYFGRRALHALEHGVSEN